MKYSSNQYYITPTLQNQVGTYTIMIKLTDSGTTTLFSIYSFTVVVKTNLINN